MKRLVTEGAAVNQASADSSARDRVRARRMARKRRKTLRAIIVVLAVCCVLVGAYAFGFTYYSTHFFPGTRVAGVDAAGMTEPELSQAIDAKLQTFEAQVTNGNFEMKLPGSVVDLYGDAPTLARNYMVRQDASSWPLSFLGIVSTNDPVLSFDANKLAVTISEAVGAYNKNAEEPVSASLALSELEDSFVLKGEQAGTALDSSAVYEVVKAALERGESLVELAPTTLAQPKYKEDSPETQAALKHANEVLGYDIGLTRDGKNVSHITAKSFMPWLVVEDDLSLTVNQEAATTWAEQELWLNADYVDDAGVHSVDAETFAQNLSNSIRWENGSSFDVPYRTVSRYLSGGGSLNPTPWKAEVGRYIDVNKKDQVACLYDATGKVLWETVVTTGNEAVDCGTPLGTFGIYDKKTDFTLLGYDENNDGKPDYEHHVDFWMPFNEGIGLHDAEWRSAYGGEEYLENGSGGCVNLPHEAAEALYSIAHVGDVVIVHQ